MSEPRTFTRAELLTMAASYHGRVISTEKLNQLSNERLTGMCHPRDVDRKSGGW